MSALDLIVTDAIKHLDAAKLLLREVKLSTTDITIHWVDVARIHAEATRDDIRRFEQDGVR